MTKSKQTLKAEIGRLSKFGAVGIINTLIDFSLLNIFNLHFGLSLVLANTLSASVAMVFSFIANKKWVFNSKQTNLGRQIVLFTLITASGIYVLQNSVIYLLVHHLTSVGALAVRISHGLLLSHFMSDKFVQLNTAKAIGTLFSLAWNYSWYKRTIFK